MGRGTLPRSYPITREPLMINPKDVYFLTYTGKSELSAAGTSMSSAELELLVLLDGKATVAEVQARAKHLPPSTVIKLLEKLLQSEHIALQQIDLGDFFAASAQSAQAAET